MRRLVSPATAAAPSSPLLAAFALVALAASGCLTTPAPVEFTPEELPKNDAAPASAPRPLPGVDVTSLSEREKDGWWRLVSRLYAPCPEQAVSVATCVEQARPCVACAPLARFLAQRIHAGDSTVDAEAAAAARFGADVRPVDLADSPAKGPASAPVTIVAWSDFECPACARMLPVLDEVAAKHPSEVRLVHKLYPLPKHPNAHKAALAAWAAHRQGKYWEMERKLFADQTRLSEADLVRHAREIGLDVQRFEADRTSEAAEAFVARDKKAADAAGLSGTPHIVINGRKFVTFEDSAKDLEAWVALELELVAPKAAPPPSSTNAAPAQP